MEIQKDKKIQLDMKNFICTQWDPIEVQEKGPEAYNNYLFNLYLSDLENIKERDEDIKEAADRLKKEKLKSKFCAECAKFLVENHEKIDNLSVTIELNDNIINEER